MADIVNAAKHGEINRPTPHGAPYVKDANQIEEQTWIIEYEDAEGTYRHDEKVVTLKMCDGSERDVLEVLTNVINFWEEFNFSTGITKDRHEPFRFSMPGRWRSRAACTEEGITLEMVAGRRFAQNWRLKFNNRTSTLEPRDMSGQGLRVRFYRPDLEVDLFLDDHTLGKTFTEMIEIHGKDAMKVRDLKSQEEKMNYVMTLDVAKKAMERMMALSMQERSAMAKGADA